MALSIPGSVYSPSFVGRIGELCLHSADFGFNAGLIKRFEEEEQRGMAGYFKSPVDQAFEYNKFQFDLPIFPYHAIKSSSRIQIVQPSISMARRRRHWLG
ncbi:MAG: hypothetical protein JJU34_12130 [Lunatimonas sp.]|uniref:hypothetical protein n=1 Tax=Lunatimonas sp. TaxID=2060141 RepID=UPI00263BBE56|nr:hypothetical protein [Lunatimonas sp.]MCC5938020.1 hypothetical protein [Lunatimonas sp.]